MSPRTRRDVAVQSRPANPPTSPRQHRGRSIDPDQRDAGSPEGHRDASGAASELEHRAAGAERHGPPERHVAPARGYARSPSRRRRVLVPAFITLRYVFWPTVAKSMVFWISTKPGPAFAASAAYVCSTSRYSRPSGANRVGRRLLEQALDRLLTPLSRRRRAARRRGFATQGTAGRSAARSRGWQRGPGVSDRLRRRCSRPGRTRARRRTARMSQTLAPRRASLRRSTARDCRARRPARGRLRGSRGQIRQPRSRRRRCAAARRRRTLNRRRRHETAGDTHRPSRSATRWLWPAVWCRATITRSIIRSTPTIRI